MITTEVTWSSFLREPTSVERLLERGDVLLRRRDGEPLRLTRAAGDENAREALATLARLLTAPVLREALHEIEQHLDGRLPWTRFLPAQDRSAFVREFVHAFEACADLGDYTALGRLLVEWKNTAAAYAAGDAVRLKRPLRGLGPRVPRPGR